MAVYVDQLFPTAKSAKWPFLEACHLLTDGPIQELHAFAAKLQLREAWFQGHHVNPRLHHYDLTRGKRFQALKLGAVEINDGQQFLAILNGTATTPEAKPAPEPKWTVLIGERYEYTREWKTAKVTVKTSDGKKREEWKTGYFVQCLDTVKPEYHMDHGPFSLEEANEMIESRIRRDKELRRDR